ALFGAFVAAATHEEKIAGKTEVVVDRLGPLALDFGVAAAVMLIGALVAWFLGVDAEQKSLEDIAPPRTPQAAPPRTPPAQPHGPPKLARAGPHPPHHKHPHERGRRESTRSEARTRPRVLLGTRRREQATETTQSRPDRG